MRPERRAELDALECAGLVNPPETPKKRLPIMLAFVTSRQGTMKTVSLAFLAVGVATARQQQAAPVQCKAKCGSQIGFVRPGEVFWTPKFVDRKVEDGF